MASKPWSVVRDDRSISFASRRRTMTAAALSAAAMIVPFVVADSASAASGQKAKDAYITFGLNDRSTIGTDVRTGNLLVRSSDLSIKGVGQDVAIDRYYHSQSDPDAPTIHGQSFGNMTGGPLDAYVTYWNGLNRGQLYFGQGDGQKYLFDGDSSHADPPPQLDADLDNPEDATKTVTFRGSSTTWDVAENGDATISDRNGNTVHYYGGSGGTTIATDTQGRAITAVRNGNGYITKVTDPSGRHEDYTYGTGSNADLMATYSDGAGKTTTYGYDSSKRLNKVTTAGGRITKVSYDTSGRVATITRVTNNTTETGNVTTFSYGQTDSRCGNGSQTTGVSKVTDARGNVTSYCFDTANEPAAVDVIDPLGNHQKATYDTQGHVTANGTGSTLTNTGYNSDGTIADSQRPAGEKTTYSYAGTGSQYQPSSITDPDKNSQFFGYDGNGNLTSVKDNPTTPNLQATLTYNPDGTIASATDGESHITTYGYYGTADGVKRGYLKTVTLPTVLSSMTQPGVTTLTYDSLGHVATATDGRGKVTTYTYDDLDRTKTVTFDNSSVITYTYDDDGNQTQRTDSTGGTYTYTYNKQNQRTHEGLPGSRSADYTYDEVGNLKTLQDGSATTLYGYDTAGRPCFAATTTSTTGTCANPPTNSTTFTYDASNNRTATTYPNGVAVTNTFDSSQKPLTLSVKHGSTVLDDRTYTYKTYTGTTAPNGQLLATLSYPHDGGSWTYNYNASGMLSQASRPGSPSGTEQTDYTYDKAGNRTKKGVGIVGSSPTSTVTAGFNAANQLCWTGGAAGIGAACGSAPTGATSFTYDAAGNDLRFGYNDRNQTISGGGSLAYAGPNQFELIDDAGATVENNLLGVGRKINGSNTTTYTRDTDGTLLFRTLPSGAKEYFALDAQGSVIDITDSTGARTAAYKYDPDGNTTTTATPTDFGYTSAYRRGGTSPLYHNGLRWYDPTTARWTQPDVLDQPSDLQNANRYLYVGSDPINYADPTGQVSCSTFGIGGVCKTVSKAVSSKTGQKILGVVGGCAKGAVEGAKYTPGQAEVGAAAGCLINGAAGYAGVDLTQKG